MPHYQRNIRFLFFVVSPIIGFILGWSVSQKMLEEVNHNGPLIPVEQEAVSDVIETKSDDGFKLDNFSFKKTSAKDVDMDAFWDAWNLMEENYLRSDDFNTQDQLYGATKGMVDSLGDPYTTFMSPTDMNEFKESMSGEFQGIGAFIEFKDDNLVIVSPVKDSPADKSGLKSGDVIYKIEEDIVPGLSIDQAVAKIRGPKGTPVMLTILREGERKPLEITIVRDDIVIKSVEWEMRDDVAVIMISQFGNHVQEEFQTALEEIVLKSPSALIVDLRNNGGGLLDQASEVMSEFLDHKVVVKTKGRKRGDTGDLMSRKGGSLLNFPLIVLVNGGSASASEIFAGAMQDHNRGYVIGTQTFGKGTVQNLIDLSDGSALKVTVSEWLTPEGRFIHDVGIEPDEIVEISEEDYENDIDTVLERGIEILTTGSLPELMTLQAERLSSESETDNSEDNNETNSEN